MQNRYTCDLGDFGKYGLLRALCGPSSSEDAGNLRLGVVWYLVPDESHTDDGKHINYLCGSSRNRRRFRSCDPYLYDTLAKITIGGERSVRSIRTHGILPTDTVYYEEPLSFEGILPKAAKLSCRSDWVRGAHKATRECDIVFVDPDNGLEVKVKRHHKKGPKYVFYDELSPYLQRGQSLVIYHHIGRKGKAEEQIKERFAQMEDCLNCTAGKFALLYRRGTSRVFFLIPSAEHIEIITKRVGNFINSPWSQHFTRIDDISWQSC